MDLPFIATAFELGPVTSFSNAALTTPSGKFLVRASARSEAELQFEAELVEFLVAAGFPAPPLVRARGAPFLSLEDKRITVLRDLPGEVVGGGQVMAEHCLRVGRELGKLHRLTAAFGGRRDTSDSPQLLPRGAIHGGVGLGQVKWLGDRISALTGFEGARTDAYVRDVSYALKAWCADRALEGVLLRGYQEERPLDPNERAAIKSPT